MNIRTKEYVHNRHHLYPFDEFNPVQSEILSKGYAEEWTNVVVASPTASGKTICGELLAGKFLNQGYRVAYLSPLKALVEEKINDWSDESHPWHQYKLFAMTGDYVMTPKREKELQESNIVISTYEMLAVRSRRTQRENSEWLDEIGCLIVDEAHFIASEGRGDHLENALVSFTRRNPQARIIFLSATMKNSREVVDWLEVLNGKETRLVQSDYRPCELSIAFNTYPKPKGNQWKTYAENEELKIDTVLDTIREDIDDQWLIFVHSKKTGKAVVDAIKQSLYLDSIKIPTVAFHNADLTLEKRRSVEEQFKSGKLRYLVATSTLAYGLNLPARRVAIVGVHRGINEVDPMDIIQECGRAGRPRYDKEGNAYIIISDVDYQRWRTLIEDGVDVESTLHNKVGFHLIGEIAEKRVNVPSEATEWSDRTFSYLQGMWKKSAIEELFLVFEDEKLIEKKVGELCAESLIDPWYQVTQLGRIASNNYFDPLDVVRWKKNIYIINDRDLRHSDAAIAWMYCCTESNKGGFIPKELKFLSNDFIGTLSGLNLSVNGQRALANSTILYNHLQGQTGMLSGFKSAINGMVVDSDRVCNCLSQISERVLGHDEAKSRRYWSEVGVRIKYGVGWNQAGLCRLKGIGKVHSKTLMDNGIDGLKSFSKNLEQARAVLPEKAFESAYTSLGEVSGTYSNR